MVSAATGLLPSPALSVLDYWVPRPPTQARTKTTGIFKIEGDFEWFLGRRSVCVGHLPRNRWLLWDTLGKARDKGKKNLVHGTESIARPKYSHLKSRDLPVYGYDLSLY